MGASLEFVGMDEIQKWVEETGNKVSAVAGPALQAAAEPILADMKHTTAWKDRKDKLLRSSLGISPVKAKKGVRYVLVGIMDGKAWYGRALERGTSKMSAHPFMRPAFERQKENAYQIMRDKIREAIK